MQELIILLSKKLPEDFLLRKLKDDLELFMSASKEEREDHPFKMSLALLATRYMTEGQDMEAISKKIDQVKDFERMFGNKEN